MASETSTGGSSSPRVVFDVSTIMKADTLRPTGIHRVVLETARELLAFDDPTIAFTRYDDRLGRYREVGRGDVTSRIDDMMMVRPGAPAHSSRTRGRRVLAIRSLVLALRRVAPLTGRHGGAALGHLRRAGSATRATFASIRPDAQRHLARRRGTCHSADWSPTTTYISLGLDGFDFNDLDHLLMRKRSNGFRVAMTVYDLIPFVAPQFSTQDLTRYFTALLRVSDTVLVISTQTHRDLTTFAAEHSIAMPTVECIPLPSSLIAMSPVRPTTLPSDVDQIGFALFVSTITARKNHHLLLDVWTRLLTDDARPVPFLVFAGSRGSLSDETMNRIQRDRRLARRVIHLEGLADAEIAWLYRECAFTLYPSFYEGWGLPVTESLDFGKVCIASDRTSLPEAGEGLAVLLDPTDLTLWSERVRHLWDDDESRHRSEASIRTAHRHRDAVYTTERILEAAGVTPAARTTQPT